MPRHVSAFAYVLDEVVGKVVVTRLLLLHRLFVSILPLSHLAVPIGFGVVFPLSTRNGVGLSQTRRPSEVELGRVVTLVESDCGSLFFGFFHLHRLDRSFELPPLLGELNLVLLDDHYLFLTRLLIRLRRPGLEGIARLVHLSVPLLEHVLQLGPVIGGPRANSLVRPFDLERLKTVVFWIRMVVIHYNRL